MYFTSQNYMLHNTLVLKKEQILWVVKEWKLDSQIRTLFELCSVFDFQRALRYCNYLFTTLICYEFSRISNHIILRINLHISGP